MLRLPRLLRRRRPAPRPASGPRPTRLVLEPLEDRTLPAGAFLQTNLISDLPGVARITDPNLKNPWGVAVNPAGDFWVSDAANGTVTLYKGDVGGQPISTDSPVITVPHAAGRSQGAPSGQVFNPTRDFAVGSDGPALFIFAGLDGTISAIAPVAYTGGLPPQAQLEATIPGAVYTGLALASNASGNFLYAANAAAGTVDVFDKSFRKVTLAGSFTDPGQPANLAPFNVVAVNGTLYVTYESKLDRFHGGGVDKFDTDGKFLGRFAGGANLNAPWAVVQAPAGFGAFGGDLLVGNFGDGRISAYDPTTGALLGQLTGRDGQPLAIERLWQLVPGNGTSAGGAGTLYFSGGLNAEKDGLFGSLRPVSVNDGFDKLGAYRPGDGSWSLDSNGKLQFDPKSSQVFLHFSPPGVTPVSGDWTHSGHATIGDFKDGVWHLDLNGNGVVDAGETFTFGQAGDKPVVGDWTGDGKAKLGVFRAAPDGVTGEFILDVANHKAMDASNLVFTFGLAKDRIVVGDWTGDGKAKVGVFRDATAFGAPGAAVFSLDAGNHHTFDSSSQVFIFGLITDGLVVGDWTGDGVSKVGVYRDGSAGFNAPGVALFSLDTNGNRQFDAGVDAVFLYGFTSDKFVTGNWTPTPPLLPAQFAAGGRGPGDVAALTDAQLEPVLRQAVADWAARGADAARLGSVPVRVGHLDGALVGWTAADGITLDAEAAGWGWYADPTPGDAGAFTLPTAGGLAAPAGSPAAGKMDLLTVVEHELGHELGLSDVDPAAHPGDLMAATLPAGTRRAISG